MTPKTPKEAKAKVNAGRRKEAPSDVPSGETLGELLTPPSRRPPEAPTEREHAYLDTFGALALALLAALTITVSLAIVFDPEGDEPSAFVFPCSEDDALLDTGECVDVRATSSIGGTLVPDNLDCAEDEVIGFVAGSVVPFPLGCVHVDTFCPEGQHVGGSNRCEADAQGAQGSAPTPDCQTMSAVDQARLCDETGAVYVGEPTPEAPTATPCGPSTYRECGTPVIAMRSTDTVALCSEVSARMRALVQDFDPNGEPPSRTLLGKLGRVNEPVCKARVDAERSTLCVATQTAVNDVLARSEKEPEVLSQSQLAMLRSMVDLVCEA